MPNVTARLYHMPMSIKAFVHEDMDGDYTILINEALSIQQRYEAFVHEMNHIDHYHFEYDSAEKVEKETDYETHEIA